MDLVDYDGDTDMEPKDDSAVVTSMNPIYGHLDRYGRKREAEVDEIVRAFKERYVC